MSKRKAVRTATKHKKDRTGRVRQFLGQFHDCRHHISEDATSRGFHCAKSDTHKTTCEGCFICPKCDGPLFTYRLVTTRGRDCLYAEHDKSCVICGAYIEETLRVPLAKIAEQKSEDACQVHGCSHTAYEEHRTVEELDGQETTFIICETHRRRIKTWRLHPDKGESQKPLIIENGRLVDNPAYCSKRQDKHLLDTK